MIQFYHNSRCGKSREALTLLQESGKEFVTINYLQTPPSASEIKLILKKLDIQPIELVRQNETLWKTTFKDKPMDDDTLIEILVSYPILIERPIVVNGEKAVIGRPSTKILTII